MDDVHRGTIGIDLGVCGVEALGDVRDDPDDVLEGHRDLQRAVLLEDGPHVLAIHVLHRDEVLLAGLRELVDPRDAWMVEDRRNLGLVDQHADEIFVRGQMLKHALHCNEACTALGIERLGAIDLGHPPECNAIEKLIPPELLRLWHSWEVRSLAYHSLTLRCPCPVVWSFRCLFPLRLRC